VTIPTRLGDDTPTGPREPRRLPVPLVAPGAGRVAWLIDRPAASSDLPSDRAS